MSVILSVGQVPPIFLFLYVLESDTIRDWTWIVGLSVLAIAAPHFLRIALIGRFHPMNSSEWMRSLGVLVLVSIGWYTWFQNITGNRAVW
jgi:hypothetical protein